MIRIKLIKMNDPFPLPPSSTGTVVSVDNNGDLEVDWDCGSHLKLIPTIDNYAINSDDDQEVEV